MESSLSVNIKKTVEKSVIDIFETMLSMPIEPGGSDPQPPPDSKRYGAVLKFAGQMVGIINMQLTWELAQIMSAAMLGIEPDQIESQDDVKNLIAEVCSIVGGNLKSACTDRGLKCELSTPSITDGSDFTIESLNMTSYDCLAFCSEGHDFFVEVGLKVSESHRPENANGKHLPYEVEKDTSQAPEPDTPLSVQAAENRTGDAVRSDAGPRQADTMIDPARFSLSTQNASESKPGGSDENSSKPEKSLDMGVILDIPLEITVELGRSRLPIHELLRLRPGSAVCLSRLESEPVDILANDTLIAKGVVVVHNEKYGIRITELTSRLERLRSIG